MNFATTELKGNIWQSVLPGSASLSPPPLIRTRVRDIIDKPIYSIRSGLQVWFNAVIQPHQWVSTCSFTTESEQFVTAIKESDCKRELLVRLSTCSRNSLPRHSPSVRNSVNSCSFLRRSIWLSHPLHVLTGQLCEGEKVGMGLNFSLFLISYTIISAIFHVQHWGQHYGSVPRETESYLYPRSNTLSASLWWLAIQWWFWKS